MRRRDAVWHCFNPHPPIKAGETCGNCFCRMFIYLFQSAPANKGGRNKLGRVENFGSGRFQSAPANKGGRNIFRTRIAGLNECFNPPPPIKAGETSLKPPPVPVDSTFQSAPANKGGRNPVEAVEATATTAFQSAPANKGGRNVSLNRTTTPGGMFQSAPANKGGRNRYSRCPVPAFCSFNPHPPIKAGETRPRWRSRQSAQVSIRTRQ